MTFLPIVVRELRVAPRGRALYHTRFWTAAGCLGFGAYLFAIFGRAGPLGIGGRFIFSSLSYVGFLYCLVMARNTVDCISQEKREGTLGLLFLTDLKGYDVALGKLFANSLRSFYGLLAAVPVVCCVWVMGGVNLPELGRVVLALMNVFFFSHVAGLLVSTYSRDARRATSGTGLLLSLYCLGIPGLVALLNYKFHGKGSATLALFDPGYAFRQSGFAGSRWSMYWISLLVVNLNAWLFVVLTSLRLPRCWQDKPRDARSAWRERLRQWCFGPPEVREALRRELLDINPFLWLISRNRLGQAVVWGGLGLMGCALVWGVSEIGWGDAMPLFVASILIGHGVLKFWIASETCVHLEEQRRSGALEFLLSCTPLSVAEIIRGQWLALQRRFLGPLIALLVLDVFLILVTALPIVREDSESKGQFMVAAILAVLMLVLDAWAIGWVGMWRAMLARKPRQAAGQAVSRIVLLPWLLMSLLLGFAGVMGARIESFWGILIIWFLLGAGVDWGFAFYARQGLHTQFRALAAVQVEEPIGVLGQIGRMLGKMWQ